MTEHSQEIEDMGKFSLLIVIIFCLPKGDILQIFTAQEAVRR